MLIYGDLDKTELRELPAGRSPIVTEVVGPGRLERTAVYERVRVEVARGAPGLRRVPARRRLRQARRRATTEEFERLAAEELHGLRLGLLHGQMPVRRQGGGDGASSVPARSTCWSRRP